MAPWRVALGIAVVVVLAVVTGTVLMSSFGDDPSVAGTPIAAAPTATATSTPTVDPDPMPELHNTGEDFDQIIRSIEAFRDWLFRNPSPALARRIYHQDCECHDELVEKLETLRADGVRFSSGRVVVESVEVLDAEEGGAALRVVDRSEPITVVDEHGNVVDTSEGWSARTYRYLLVRSEDGEWLVKDIAAMGDGGSRGTETDS